jgi:hypothetical protein
VEPAAPVPVAPALPEAPATLEPAAPVSGVPPLPELIAPAAPVLPAEPVLAAPAVPAPDVPPRLEPVPAPPPCPVAPAPPSLETGVTLPHSPNITASEAKQRSPRTRLGKLRMLMIIRMAPLTGNQRRAPDRRRAMQSVADRKRIHARGRAIALLVASMTLGCKHDAPPPEPAQPSAVAKTQPPPAAAAPVVGTPAEAPSPDAKAALAWIDALRERDSGTVLSKTFVPFDFRDGSRKKKCGARGATTRAEAATITRCLAKDESFHADLSATPEPRLVAIDAATLPPWAQPWAKTLGPGVRPISTFVHGEDEARELVLLVGDDGVRGLWQNVIPEPK